MNRFRANLHPAFFNKNKEKPGDAPEVKNLKEATTEVVQQAQKEEKQLKKDVLDENVRRNNEALASSTIIETPEEKEKTNEEITKQLETQLKQLAKNKKIDFPWTDNAWKCSRAEKRLAIGSAKVFQQLLENGNLKTIIEKCKSQNGELTETEAENWKKELEINSKTKDIQRFYKSFQEYQNPQSKFQHLKNLMGFFCENDFNNKESLQAQMRVRSERISKQDIEKGGRLLYQEGEKDGKRVIIDNKTGKEIDNKPKDWKQRASFEIIKDRLKNGIGTERMLTLLGDFNLDGEVNSGDVGYKTGSQFVDVFRRTVATQHLKDANFNDDKAVENLVAYANKFGMNINAKTVDQLYQWMTDEKEGYEHTTILQNFLKNLPIELGDVLENGENAGDKSLESITSALNIEEKERKDAEEAAKQKAKDIVLNGEAKLKEVIKDDRERANITQNLLSQLPGMLLDKAMGEKVGGAIGVGVPLDQIIKGMSAGFNVGIGTDGKPKFGLFVGWDRKFDLSKTTDLRTAVSAGTKLLFVPCAATSIELGKDVNKGSREKSLDAKGEHRVTLGGNITAVPGVFSYGFSAGYESNKQLGIEKQAKNINSIVKQNALDWIKKLDPKNKELSLMGILADSFPNSSEEETKIATMNLLSIIQGFKIDEKSTDEDFNTYAQVIADVYSEQWRNAKLSGIADDKRKISGGKVGIQFIAGCVPITTLVVKFTKYRNARTNETEHSRTARLDAQVNGTGNEIVNLGDSKEVGEAQVSQINEILERYGAKSNLKYSKPDNKEVGRIEVPASIADGIGINVRVSEGVKGYVKQESDGSYSFPANATYRLLQETGGNQRSLTLNIGSDKSSTSDIMISDAENMKSLLGDKELVDGKKWEYKSDFEDKGSIEYRPDFMEQLFTEEVTEGLKSIDSDRKKFSEFMRNKTAAEGDFDESVTKLTAILENTNSELYEDIIKELKEPHKEDSSGEIIKDVAVKKQLIIDRIMAISAYANVHDKVGLESNIRQRGEYYKSLKGPNGQSIFDKLSDRDRNEFVKDLESYEPVFMPDVIGVTAFYHRNNAAKGLSLTGLGATYALGGKTETLEGEDFDEADKWFLGQTNEEGNNIPGALSKEKSPQERENTMRCVKEKLPEGATLTDENLKDLLKGDEVELTLDNSQKITIKIDKEYVRYLMGECGNESIGMRLKIKIKKQEQVDNYKQGALYLNNGEGSNRVGIEEKRGAVGVSVGGQKKKEKKEEEEKPEHRRGSDPDGGTPEGDDGTIPEVEGGEIGSNPEEGGGTQKGGDTASEGDDVEIDHSEDGVL